MRVARRRVDGVDGRHPGRPVVGVVHAAVAVEQRLRVDGQDGVRPERPDLAHELLAQGEVVGEGAVGLVQERDARRSPRCRPRPAAPPRAARASSSGSVRQSSAPASPLVQHTSQPAEPSSIQRAAVAAGPKSASSGCATITMNRSGRQACGVAGGGLGHARVTSASAACPGSLGGVRRRVDDRCPLC